MIHTVDLIVERLAAEKIYEASEKEYALQNKKIKNGLLWKGIAIAALAGLFYSLQFYSKDWLNVGHITMLVSLYFFYNYWTVWYDYKEGVKEWKKALNVFYETFRDHETIRYEFNEEKIARVEKGITVKEVAWEEIQSYLIVREGIFLYFGANEEFRIPKQLASSEEAYRRLEETAKTVLTRQNKPLYVSPAEKASYKKKTGEIFSYIFAPPASWITVLFTAICIGIWIGISLQPEPTWAAYNRWGYFSYPDLLNGNYEGLLTNAFVHIAFWHLFMNLYWLLIFGSKIEKEMGMIVLVVLTITSAVISSAFQVIFSDATGIGMSGVLYAYFGFIMVAGFRSEKFRYYLDKSDIRWFLLWLLVCVFITYLELLNIGNAAHTSGLIWGAFVALFLFYKERTIMAIAAMVVMIALSSLPFVWAPWSVNWLADRAYREHKDGHYEKARYYYDEILAKDPENDWAKESRKMLPE